MSEEVSSLYAFDDPHNDVTFDAVAPSGNLHPVTHRLRKPTLEELNIREQQIKYELRGVSARKDRIFADDVNANIILWDKIVVAVKGYGGGDEWQELSDTAKAQFNPDHKSRAIADLYRPSCEIEGDDDRVPMGPVTWTVRQNIGNRNDPSFIVCHILREPTQRERDDLRWSASITLNVRGAKQSQVEVITKLKPHVELYDALIQAVRGGTVGGEEGFVSNGKGSLAAIDPMFKRHVIQCLLEALSGQQSD